MNRVLLYGVVIVLTGCNLSGHNHKMPEGSLLPPKGTPMAQVEQVYGKVQRVLPPDPKQPEELHVYNALPRLLLRVSYDRSNNVAWSEFLHLDATFYPVSAKPDSLSPEVIEHDREVKERDLTELRKKIDNIPWSK